MEPCKIHRMTKPLVHAQGLEGKEISSPSGRRRKTSLTSPLIDRDFSPINSGSLLLRSCKRVEQRDDSRLPCPSAAERRIAFFGREAGNRLRQFDVIRT